MKLLGDGLARWRHYLKLALLGGGNGLPGQAKILDKKTKKSNGFRLVRIENESEDLVLKDRTSRST